MKVIVSIIKQWIHWIWKTFLYWIFLSSELFVWFFEFFSIVNLLIQSFEMKTSLRICIRSEKTSWRSRLSFTIVNVFFHARNHAFFMRETMFFALFIVKMIASIDSKIKSSFLCHLFLKFIENDHLSWKKNVVNRKWWMRKWIVKMSKMRLNEIINLRKDFFFFVSDQTSLSLRLSIFANLSVDFFCLLKKFFFFWTFVMSSVWDSFSIDLNVIKFDRSLSKSFKMVFDKNSRSKCCQKCIKFLIENFNLKCI